ncbi:MAG: ATP-binding cassette domain-containing protein [Actinomycetota bacterium]|nr:ATP-binding cassette domain-containing protein [Actinomycetota bacterium]
MSPTSKGPIINCSRLNYFYDNGLHALLDIDFSAKGGEFIALLAANGSGKTTLLKVIAGLLEPKSGSVFLGGRDMASMKRSEIYSRVGLVMQNPKDQLFCTTVKEDVSFGPRNQGLSEKEAQVRVNEALSAVGGLHLKERAIHHLSFGEQKRISLAGVLAMEPDILLLDEVTAGLDPSGEAEMIALLKGLNRNYGTTIIFATHSIDPLPLFSDRVFILKNGKILSSDSCKEAFSEPRVLMQAGLRLPYISILFHQLKTLDGLAIDGLPMTVKAARESLLEMIPKEAFELGGKEGDVAKV